MASEVHPRPTFARGFALWLAVVLGIGLLMFTYHHLSVVASGGSRPAIKALINELTAAFGAGVLFWGVRALALRHPLGPGTWWPRAPLYLGALLLYSTLHTSSNWALRALLYPLAGQGAYDYGAMPVRYVMELPIDVLGFAAMVGTVHWVGARRRARQRAFDAERLARRLTESQLANLRLQLQPHFLFNALNTISATMYRDVEAADTLIERLGDLLRGSLTTARDDLVPLHRELAWLRAYIDLLEARFEDRLRVDLEVEPGLDDALVPAMALQPLVENAVRHGGVEQRGHGVVTIRAERFHRTHGSESPARRPQPMNDRADPTETPPPQGAGGQRARTAEDMSEPKASSAGRPQPMNDRADLTYLVLTVHDDGPGTDRPLDPHDATSVGFGLHSVAERLRLLYGDDQRFALGNDPDGGFTATLIVPDRHTEADA